MDAEQRSRGARLRRLLCMDDAGHPCQPGRHDRRNEHRAVDDHRVQPFAPDHVREPDRVHDPARDLQRPARGERAPDRQLRRPADEPPEPLEARPQRPLSDRYHKLVPGDQVLGLAQRHHLGAPQLGAVDGEQKAGLPSHAASLAPPEE